MAEERAVLAGGCFWGMQDLIRRLPGITRTRVGYTGGDVANATYRNHGTHAEGIEICSIRRKRATAAFWNSSSRSMTRRRPTVRATTSA
jgi:peptide methionine sulfoxide reductase MsrA